MAFVNFNIFLDPAKHAELSFDTDTSGMCAIDDALGDFNVLLERFMASIDHDRAVEARFDTIVASFLVAVIEMNGKDGLGKYSLSCPNHRLKHPFIGILPAPHGYLDDEVRASLHIPAKQNQQTLHVANVIV